MNVVKNIYFNLIFFMIIGIVFFWIFYTKDTKNIAVYLEYINNETIFCGY